MRSRVKFARAADRSRDVQDRQHRAATGHHLYELRPQSGRALSLKPRQHLCASVARLGRLLSPSPANVIVK